MTTPTANPAASDLLASLREALQAAEGPQTAAQILKALPGPKKPKAPAIEQLLETEVAEGRAFRWEPSKGKAKAFRFWTKDPAAHSREALRAALAVANEPVTAEQLHKTIGKAASGEAIGGILEEEVAEGRAFRFEPTPPKGKGKAKAKGEQRRYWGHNQDYFDRRVMLGVLEKGKGPAKGPLSWADVAKALKGPLAGSSEDRLNELLFDLLEKGEVHKALNFGANKKKPDADRYMTRPPDLVAHVGEAIGEIRKKFAVAGVAAEAVDRAALAFLGGAAPQAPAVARPAPDDLPAAVLKIFHDLKREKFGHTGLVPIFEVRRLVASRFGPESARHDVLDETIKGLWRAGRLTLLPLNDATGVSVDEMNDAMPGLNEVWFYLESRS